MKTLILTLTSLILLASCGGREEGTPTNFEIKVGNLVSAGNLDGGVVIVGSGSNGKKFSYASHNANNVSIPLEEGIWNFVVFGWKNTGGNASAPMEGENVCGARAGVNISGNSSNVNINLAQGNCDSLPQINSLSKSASPVGQFKVVNFNSCLTTAGFQASTPGVGVRCNNSDLDHTTGTSTSIRIRVPSLGDIPSESLVSKCININSYNPPNDPKFDGNFFDSGIRLPIGNGVGDLFPIEILGYEDANCSDDDAIVYHFSNGFAGPQEADDAHSFAYDDGPTSINLAWADNYTGIADSAFRATVDSVILPSIDCNGGDCHGTIFSDLPFSVYPRDTVLERIYSLFGAPGQIDAHSFQYAKSSHTESGATLEVKSNNPGADLNGLEVRLLHNSGAASASAAYDPLINRISIDFNSGSHNPDQVAAAISALSGTTGVSAVCHNATSSECSSPNASWDNQSLVLSNGQLPDGRDLGLIPEIKNMILGPIGSILYKNGITNFDQVCSASAGTLSETLNGLNGSEQVTLELSTSTSITPPAYMTTKASPENFDRQVVLGIDGEAQFSFAFNCPSGAPHNGTGETGLLWFANNHDNGEERVEVFVNHTDPNKAAIEKVSLDNRENGPRRFWEYFQKTALAPYSYFSLSADESDSDSGNHFFERLGASVNAGGNVLINEYSNLASSNTDNHFSGGSPTINCKLDDFTDGTCTADAAAISPTALVGPNGGTTAPEKIQSPMLFGTDFTISNLRTLLGTQFRDF